MHLQLLLWKTESDTTISFSYFRCNSWLIGHDMGFHAYNSTAIERSLYAIFMLTLELKMAERMWYN